MMGICFTHAAYNLGIIFYTFLIITYASEVRIKNKEIIHWLKRTREFGGELH